MEGKVDTVGKSMSDSLNDSLAIEYATPDIEVDIECWVNVDQGHLLTKVISNWVWHISADD